LSMGYRLLMAASIGRRRKRYCYQWLINCAATSSSAVNRVPERPLSDLHDHQLDSHAALADGRNGREQETASIVRLTAIGVVSNVAHTGEFGYLFNQRFLYTVFERNINGATTLATASEP